MERAIQASDLGINPNNDGRMLRLVFPALTEERRRDLAKGVSKFAEEGKVAIRNIRREALEKYRGHLKKKELTEDSLAVFEAELQNLTNRYITEIEKIASDKEKDLMEL